MAGDHLEAIIHYYLLFHCHQIWIRYEQVKLLPNQTSQCTFCLCGLWLHVDGNAWHLSIFHGWSLVFRYSYISQKLNLMTLCLLCFFYLTFLQCYILICVLYPLFRPLRDLTSHSGGEENCATMRKGQWCTSYYSILKMKCDERLDAALHYY